MPLAQACPIDSPVAVGAKGEKDSVKKCHAERRLVALHAGGFSLNKILIL